MEFIELRLMLKTVCRYASPFSRYTLSKFHLLHRKWKNWHFFRIQRPKTQIFCSGYHPGFLICCSACFSASSKRKTSFRKRRVGDHTPPRIQASLVSGWRVWRSWLGAVRIRCNRFAPNFVPISCRVSGTRRVWFL